MRLEEVNTRDEEENYSEVDVGTQLYEMPLTPLPTSEVEQVLHQYEVNHNFDDEIEFSQLPFTQVEALVQLTEIQNDLELLPFPMTQVEEAIQRVEIEHEIEFSQVSSSQLHEAAQIAELEIEVDLSPDEIRELEEALSKLENDFFDELFLNDEIQHQQNGSGGGKTKVDSKNKNNDNDNDNSSNNNQGSNKRRRIDSGPGIVSYSQEAGPSNAYDGPEFNQSSIFENDEFEPGEVSNSETVGPGNDTSPSSNEVLFHISKVREINCKKFKTRGTDYSAEFSDTNLESLIDTITTLHRAIEDILTRVLDGVPSHDMVRLVLDAPSLNRPISFPFQRRDEITPERIMSRIEKVLQSNENFKLDSAVRLNIVHVSMPKGGVGNHLSRARAFTLENFLKNKRSIIRIKNDDNLCMSRALVTARAKIDNDEAWNSIRRGYLAQEVRAIELQNRAGIPLGELCGIPEVKQFQEVMPGYQIHILSREYMNAIIYSGPEAENKIYLYHHGNHYDVITSMSSMLGRCHFCTSCNKGYDHIEGHRCAATCRLCFRGNCTIDNDEDWVYCSDCNRYFKGEVCFQNHKYETSVAKNSICKSFMKCRRCTKVINVKNRNPRDHECGEVKCKVCNQMVNPNSHVCFIQPSKQSNPNSGNRNDNNDHNNGFHSQTLDSENDENDCEGDEVQKYIFFDLETLRRLPEDSGTVYNLETNLAVVHVACDQCKDQLELDGMSYCDHCGYKEKVFGGNDTIKDFCSWLFDEPYKNAICIAHNLKSFDAYPILRYLYDQGVTPKLILNGAKVMSMEVPHLEIKFIDSLSFLPMPLSKLPAAFGISELEKGYFPHLFNIDENQNYVGPLPAPYFYGFEDMRSIKDREKFTEWYRRLSSNNYIFNFQEEIQKYCESDVDILRRCCMQFRDDFIKITDLDPFAHCITIASACNLVYRTKFLKKNTIGIIPPLGYEPSRNYSIKATKWLMWKQHSEGKHIQHAKNGGEYRLGPYHLDGYILETNTALEFQGCLFHGCAKCYLPDTINPVNGKKMSELYEATLGKREYIRIHGYKYEEVWECEFDREMRNNEAMGSYVKSLNITDLLQPREAFFGGRTNATCLYYEAKENEKMYYLDFTSLYPWTNKYCSYPVKHPEIILQDFRHVSEYFGLIKCKILPPRELFHPLLPVRCNGKLMFPLCKKCSESLQQEPCQHEVHDRAFVGTWVTLEVEKALELGYEILETYEVWHFAESSDELFTDYVNTFLKLKQEASGWPAWCRTEEDKERYIREYFEKEGVQMVYDNIMKNPGLRALAKLMLNSFWGKFGERNNLNQVQAISTPSEYFTLLLEDKFEVTDVIPMSDEMIEVHYRHPTEFVEMQGKTNVVIAAFTTAHARLKLYSVLEQLGERTLYFDTDSVVFVQREGEWEPPRGDYLGELTDELDGDYITTFVSGGPKNYAYKTATNKTCCKVRGISLNCRSSQVVNFETVKAMVRDYDPNSVAASVQVFEPNKIVRDKRNKTLHTRPMNKDYRVVYNKRVIRDNYMTYPYGY